MNLKPENSCHASAARHDSADRYEFYYSLLHLFIINIISALGMTGFCMFFIIRNMIDIHVADTSFFPSFGLFLTC
jgi:hypothetical protein